MDGSETETLDAAELAAIEAALPEEQRLAVRDYWERVITECGAEIADAPRPTSWLVARTNGQRRIRRKARRAAVAVVRKLPLHRTSDPGGSEAA